jgi:hypothetical protein
MLPPYDSRSIGKIRGLSPMHFEPVVGSIDSCQLGDLFRALDPIARDRTRRGKGLEYTFRPFSSSQMHVPCSGLDGLHSLTTAHSMLGTSCHVGPPVTMQSSSWSGSCRVFEILKNPKTLPPSVNRWSKHTNNSTRKTHFDDTPHPYRAHTRCVLHHLIIPLIIRELD